MSHRDQELELRATYRALSAEPQADLAFGDGDAANSPKTGYVPELTDPSNLRLVRGQADGQALRLRHHDRVTHRVLRPGGEVSSILFDVLEAVRIEAMGGRYRLGVRENLSSLQTDRIERAGATHIEDQNERLLPLALRHLMLAYLLEAELPAGSEPIVAPWKDVISKVVDRYGASLGDCLEDQKAYAAAACKMISELQSTPEQRHPDEGKDSPDPEDEKPDSSEGDDSEESGESASETAESQENGQQEQEQQASEEGNEGKGDDVTEMLLFGASDDLDEQAPRPQRRAGGKRGPRAPYRVFTREHDRVVSASTLADEKETLRLRAQLDEQTKPFRATQARLANRLQRLLLAQQKRSFEFNLDDGMLDTGKLSRLVIDPINPYVFKRELETDFRGACVSILIDNSGSMRGRPISIAAISAEILAQVLERCGIATEVLGFTTRAWKGGNSREAWIRAGQKPAPGRLNDILHIVYKSADESLRRARRTFGLMQREGLLKENIDGEALLWAHQRLLARPEERRILMVISDGAPVDDATLAANRGSFLEDHLVEVIETIEHRSPVELVAIGIGHDVTQYYRRAVILLDVETLGNVMIGELSSLFQPKPKGLRDRTRRNPGKRFGGKPTGAKQPYPRFSSKSVV